VSSTKTLARFDRDVTVIEVPLDPELDVASVLIEHIGEAAVRYSEDADLNLLVAARAAARGIMTEVLKIPVLSVKSPLKDFMAENPHISRHSFYN
jgi:hypothetical protein